jgi:hypothetical protein
MVFMLFLITTYISGVKDVRDVAALTTTISGPLRKDRSSEEGDQKTPRSAG